MMKYAPRNVVRYANKLARELAGEHAARWLLSSFRDLYIIGWQDATNGVEFDNKGEPKTTAPAKLGAP